MSYLHDAGRKLDRIIAEKLMGWVYEPKYVHNWTSPKGVRCDHEDIPPFSTDIASAWTVVDKLATLVGEFQHADGFFILKFSDSAGHSSGDDCDPGEIIVKGDIENEEDDSKWSCHFHPGHPGENSESLKFFKPFKKVCARGRTAEHAICLAALKCVEGMQ